MQYRRDVDGLRAIAVASVVVYHLFPKALPGGFAGVDVFFAISGFLIAQVVQRAIAAGTFSMRDFYRNRVRRLFPAMAVVTASTLLAGYVWLLPEDYEAAAKGAGSALLFVSNLYFAQHTGYFAADVSHNPMLHTWSLAVEEQFYLVFPLLLLALAPWGGKIRAMVLLVLAGVSLWWAVTTQATAPDVAFYGLHTRAWEMLAGALAGLALTGPAARMSAGVRGGMALVGLGVVGASFGLLSAASAHPGLPTLLPVIGAVLVLLCAPGTLVGRALSWGPCVYLGLISYSLYLWHQPVLVFGRLHTGGVTTPLAAVGMVGLSVALAHLTVRYVERPFRSGAWRPALTLPRFARASVLLVAAAGTVVVAQGFPDRVSPGVLARGNGWSTLYTALRVCHTDPKNLGPIDKPCTLGVGSGQGPRITILGDSHASSLAAGMVRVLGQGEVRLLSTSGCPPVRHYAREDNRGLCAQGHAHSYARAYEGGVEDAVVLAARWSAGVWRGGVDNTEGGVEGKPPVYYVPVSGAALADAEVAAGMVADYVETVAQTLAAGKRVVLVYPTPEMGWNVPHEMVRRAWMEGEEATPVSIAREVYQARHRQVIAAFDAIPDHPNLVRVRPEEMLCEGDRCYGERAGRSLYADDDHLNDLGASVVARAVLAALDARFGGYGALVLPEQKAADPAHTRALLAAIARADPRRAQPAEVAQGLGR